MDSRDPDAGPPGSAAADRVTTLIGLDDEPATLAGVPIPGEPARVIGADPDAVWHRMLLDPQGGFVELSTDAYEPSRSIWRWVVARDLTCVFPGCGWDAALVELDHRVPWPVGRTWAWNLQPLCRRHHQVKHSAGYTVRREDDGSYAWTSRFGTVSGTAAPQYPTGVWDDLARRLSGGPDLDPVEPWPSEDEVDDPLADPVIEAAYHEWFTTEILPTL